MKRPDGMARAFVVAAAMLAVLVALSGCTAGGGAIFATIEQEEPPNVSNLPDTATVTNVLVLRAGGATGFLAVARTVFIGLPTTAADFSNLTWTAVAHLIGGGAAEAVCNQAVLVSGATPADDRIYGVLTVTTSGVDTSGLYVSTTGSAFTPGDPELDWSPLVPAAAGFDGGSPEGILLVNGEIFVTVRTTALLGYALYHYDATANTATCLVAYAPVPISDGAFHDAAYWFIGGTSIYSRADLSGPFGPYSDAAITTGAAYSGIHASGTDLHLSTQGGKLFVHAAGGAWTASAELTYPSDDNPLWFTDFVSAGASVYVGSAGRGFFVLDADGLLTSTTLEAARLPDRTFSELYSGTILGFAYVSDGDVFFVRTVGTGLWHQVIGDEFPQKGWVWD
jgi:hypothetical protein